MKIKLTSVFVDDQDTAHKFYTEVLGFATKHDISLGEFKWLTVVSPEEPDGTELLLEPSDNPAARAYKDSIFQQGITAASFTVENIQQEYERMQGLGVEFTMPPTDVGMVTIAIFNDTCGNLIQLQQPN